MLPRQLVHVTHRHEFDEPDVPRVVARQCGEVSDLIVIAPAHDDDVDLDRRQSGIGGRARGGDKIEAKVTTGDLSNSLRAQRVCADVHTIKSRLRE